MRVALFAYSLYCATVIIIELPLYKSKSPLLRVRLSKRIVGTFLWMKRCALTGTKQKGQSKDCYSIVSTGFRSANFLINSLARFSQIASTYRPYFAPNFGFTFGLVVQDGQ